MLVFSTQLCELLPLSSSFRSIFLMTTFCSAFFLSFYVSEIQRSTQLSGLCQHEGNCTKYRRWKHCKFKFVRFRFNIGRVTNPHWKSLSRSEPIKSARISRWYWWVSRAHERNRHGLAQFMKEIFKFQKGKSKQILTGNHKSNKMLNGLSQEIDFKNIDNNFCMELGWS
jgi:hypothetical protein